MNIKLMDEIESELAIANNALVSWTHSCLLAAGIERVGFLDLLVLQNLCQGRSTMRLVDICCVLHIKDQHTVNYSLKKLVKENHVHSEKKGKSVFYSATQSGKGVYDTFRECRLRSLIAQIDTLSQKKKVMKSCDILSKTLQMLSGLYDQAARGDGSQS